MSPSVSPCHRKRVDGIQECPKTWLCEGEGKTINKIVKHTCFLWRKGGEMRRVHGWQRTCGERRQEMLPHNPRQPHTEGTACHSRQSVM